MKTVLFEITIDDRLSLVLPSLDYAKEIYQLIDQDREQLRRWLPWVDETQSVRDTRQNLINRIDGFRAKREAAFFGVLDGMIVASVGFVSHDKNEGEIGYWLLSEHRGRGLMTVFVTACVRYGFNDLGLKKIIIKCAAKNTKSAAVALRLGFTLCDDFEAATVIDGQFQDLLLFTLDREHWLFDHFPHRCA